MRLIQGDTSSFLENELIKVLGQINSQHRAMHLLFKEKAIESNVEGLKLLRPFISIITLNFLIFLTQGNIAIPVYDTKL